MADDDRGERGSFGQDPFEDRPQSAPPPPPDSSAQQPSSAAPAPPPGDVSHPPEPGAYPPGDYASPPPPPAIPPPDPSPQQPSSAAPAPPPGDVSHPPEPGAYPPGDYASPPPPPDSRAQQPAPPPGDVSHPPEPGAYPPGDYASPPAPPDSRAQQPSSSAPPGGEPPGDRGLWFEPDRPSYSTYSSQPRPGPGAYPPAAPYPAPYGGRPTAGDPPRRRLRRPRRSVVLSVALSLVALALGITAVRMAGGDPVEVVRYVPVRPPEVVGPAPAPGGAPTPPAPVPAAAGDAEAGDPQPGAGPPEGEAAPPAPVSADPPTTTEPAPAQEPVVAAAGRVEPSVVLLQTSQGQGSGIIYNTSGLVLTAAHVVEGAEPLEDLFALDADDPDDGPESPQVEDLEIPGVDDLQAPRPDPLPIPPGLDGEIPDVIVQLANGVRAGGKVLAADLELDVAVVQIDPTLQLTAAETAPLTSVDVGQTAVAVGSPFGMENVVTVGVVSALNQVLNDETMPPIGMIQTDAPINPGNSGGALADLQGRVIGMNVAIQSTFGGGNIGVGFATPIEVAIWIAEELRAGRQVRFGFLGITGYTPPVGEPGAIVASVTPGGPAEAAGMMVNDRIVTFAGQPVASMDELAVAVRLVAPGTEVEVEVVRGELLIRLFIPLADRGESLPEEDAESEVDPDPDDEPEPEPDPAPEPDFEP